MVCIIVYIYNRPKKDRNSFFPWCTKKSHVRNRSWMLSTASCRISVWKTALLKKRLKLKPWLSPWEIRNETTERSPANQNLQQVFCGKGWKKLKKSGTSKLQWIYARWRKLSGMHPRSTLPSSGKHDSPAMSPEEFLIDPISHFRMIFSFQCPRLGIVHCCVSFPKGSTKGGGVAWVTPSTESLRIRLSHAIIVVVS